jgi:hypothetical protein
MIVITQYNEPAAQVKTYYFFNGSKLLACMQHGTCYYSLVQVVQ